MQESCAVMSHMNESRHIIVGPLRIEWKGHVWKLRYGTGYMQESCAVMSHMNESRSKIVGPLSIG